MRRLSSSGGPHRPPPVGPALAQELGTTSALGQTLPDGMENQSRALGVKRQHGRAAPITHQSWEVSWGPWVSLLGCVWHWWSSSVRPRAAVCLPWCQLSPLGPGGARGKRLMQGVLPQDGLSTLHGPTQDPSAPHSHSPQGFPTAGNCAVPTHTLCPTPITAVPPGLPKWLCCSPSWALSWACLLHHALSCSTFAVYIPLLCFCCSANFLCVYLKPIHCWAKGCPQEHSARLQNQRGTSFAHPVSPTAVTCGTLSISSGMGTTSSCCLLILQESFPSSC